MKLRNYLLLSISTILLASCSSEAITNDSPAEERIPLRLQATLSANRPVTRAVGDAFAADDEIISYIQHVVTENETVNSVTAKTIKFTTQTATAAYWDDFSESSDASTDLRTANHGLRSYYGYCYNGGTPVENSFKETDGELKWAILANQTAGIKQYDLLWSKTTEKVSYDHAKNNHGTLSVPFTHAMSKFTIVVVAGDGFKDDDLTTATVKLFGMNSTGTFTAPTATVVPGSETVDIDMYGNTASTTDHSRAFEAVAVPQSNMPKDKHLATITMAGNTYNVIITSDMLTSWNDGITDSKSKSNYNYKLTVKLNKQAVDVKATLDDWSDVSAKGNGEIQFDADVKAVESSNYTGLKSDDSFSLWRTTDLATMGDATTFTYDGSKFVGATAIYWPNGSTSLYFRALAKTTIEHVLTAESSTSVTQGTDLLWGTSGADAIKPRTGTVPLTFSHAMSKVIVKLATTEDTDASSVDLTGATVKLTNIKKVGTIALATGDITASTEAEDNGEVTISGESIMLPQTIDTNSKLVVTLKDGTTYSLVLKDCTAGTTPITAWERGKSYTYTITVKKEAVQFRALIQDWKPATGSGQANLDWD